MAKSSEPPTGRGKIVALEGPSEIVAAQLRLLPVSSQIMILPSLQQYLCNSDVSPPSTIKQLIHRVHLAAEKRHAEAVDFLDQAAADKKRVVFLNGGTVGARVLCLSAISYNQTGGDLEKAELIFNELISNGVSGLLDEKEPTSRNSALHGGAKLVDGVEPWGELGDAEAEDPILRAMRAADALDKETESLQSPNNEVDLSACWFNNSKTWSRGSLMLPFMDFASSMGSPRLPAVSTEVPYSRSTQRSLLTSVEDLLAERMHTAPPIAQWPLKTPIPTSTLGWVNETSRPDSAKSQPSTPDSVINKQHSATVAPLFAVREDRADAKRPISVELGSLGIESQIEPSPPKPPRRKRPPMLPLVINTQCTRLRAVRSLSSLGPECANESSDTRLQIVNKRPGATSFLHNSPPGEEPKYKDRYVDKATDTMDLEADDVIEPESVEVLPLLENLVVQLLGDRPNPPLERIFDGFRSSVPETDTPSPVATCISASTPSTPVNAFTDGTLGRDLTSDNTALALGDPSTVQAIMDHEMMHGAQHGHSHAQLTYGRLPTPPYDLYLPATPQPGLGQRFQTLSVRRQTETSVQNILRLILSSYIPSEVWTQYPLRSSGSNASTSWKPVLWKPEPHGGGRSCKELDMILAIGVERSVKQGYTSAIIGQVEKLGFVSGSSRSGRLDLRYLIANAMQAFTCQPLTKQTRDSPFANSSTLASLLIPHLESYLSAHSQVRFLILEYTAEHLSTVLALRKLIGSESVKVAGIIGSDMRPPTAHSDSEKYAFAELRSVGGLDAFNNPVSPKTASIPFNKANYILTSSATRAEIAGFVSAIRDTLASKSDVYGRINTNGTASMKRTTTTTKSTLSHLKQDSTFLSTSTLDTPPASPRGYYMTAPQSPMRSPSGSLIASTTESENRDKALRGGVFLSSAASRIRSLAPSSIRSRRSHVTTMDDIGGDDDHEFDADERRLMPLYLKREAEKGNGEKALKWLGLT